MWIRKVGTSMCFSYNVTSFQQAHVKITAALSQQIFAENLRMVLTNN